RVPVPPAGRLPDMTLEQPVTPMWRVGFMTLTYSEDDKTFEVSLVELVDEGDQPATGHFEASLTQMQALAAHAAALISAGRPPCPMCGGPIDHHRGVCCPSRCTGTTARWDQAHCNNSSSPTSASTTSP